MTRSARRLETETSGAGVLAPVPPSLRRRNDVGNGHLRLAWLKQKTGRSGEGSKGAAQSMTRSWLFT